MFVSGGKLKYNTYENGNKGTYRDELFRSGGKKEKQKR